MPRPKRFVGDPSICHPGRRVARLRDGLCDECLADTHARRRGVARVSLTHSFTRTLGVTQHIATVFPSECRKCGNRALRQDGRLIDCLICGATWLYIPKEVACVN